MQVGQALREANYKIQTANERPDAPDYISKCEKAEEVFKKRVEDILFPKQK